MPKIQTWDKLPSPVREHLIERMRDRLIGIADLNELRLWIESKPEVPEGDWYKDFGSFKLCGQGSMPKTFLQRGQAERQSDLIFCVRDRDRTELRRTAVLLNRS